MRRFRWVAGALGASILLGGCSTWKVTDTQRTAVEQLLLSTSADIAASKIALPSLRGQTAFLDDKSFEATDKPYAVSALRERLGSSGILLVDDAKAADVIIEARSGALATDNYIFLLGLPAVKIPIPSSTMTSIDRTMTEPLWPGGRGPQPRVRRLTPSRTAVPASGAL